MQLQPVFTDVKIAFGPCCWRRIHNCGYLVEPLHLSVIWLELSHLSVHKVPAILIERPLLIARDRKGSVICIHNPLLRHSRDQEKSTLLV
jgi:hypothetical protein